MTCKQEDLKTLCRWTGRREMRSDVSKFKTTHLLEPEDLEISPRVLLWQNHHAPDITKNVKNQMGRLPITYMLTSFAPFP